MLNKTAQHLTWLNALVFVVVLIVFSIVVYASFVESIDRDKREHLQKLVDAIDASIGEPEQEEPDDQVPDMVEDEDHSAHAKPLQETIQWYDASQHLIAQKGLLKITKPISTSTLFVIQSSPHALLLTHKVERHSDVIGYLRVGCSLLEADLAKQNLLIGLACGITVSIFVSGGAILWLVRQALKPVERTMTQLSDFTTDASHELQSPVAVIKTNGEVALKYSDGMRESDRQKFLNMLHAANQISNTIDALLTLAELDLPSNERESLNVCGLCHEILDELADQITAKELKTQVIFESPDISIRARKEDIKTALLNIVKNAIAYSSTGGAITLRASKLPRAARLEIDDTGIGISNEDLPRIFDRFWRADKARTYRSGGNGLGLAITKKIVERYGGAISVKSALGEGTKVVLQFPTDYNAT